jgi:hypothetical protein
LLLFPEKEESRRLVEFLGACPQTPRVGFAEIWIADGFLRSRTTLFASFSGKIRRLVAFLGACPQTLRVGFAEFGSLMIFCKVKQHVLRLFWKEDRLLVISRFGYRDMSMSIIIQRTHELMHVRRLGLVNVYNK